MIRIATRNSALALAQARLVADLLGGAELIEVSSNGELGDKGRFVRGVEGALLAGEAEIGVHSAKDVPAEIPDGLTIAAVPEREDAADVWVGAGTSLDEVPEGARVGTASLRRRAQLLAARPDVRVEELHGNVDTRLHKLAEGDLDGIVLAAAGLRRLGRDGEAAFPIPAEVMIPAAGQGALVLQARGDDPSSLQAAAVIGEATALRELTAERTVVALLEATCASPIGVHASVDGGRIEVEAFVGLPDGSEWVRDRVEGDAEDPAAAGAQLAERLSAAGARDILDRAEAM
ncbi:MAG TPA: hydroxymethylbilane synthase [Solirubrobacterales bacterium]|nr:hydroxymethylbilane synthase [Solirubrobacterales bacterium]